MKKDVKHFILVCILSLFLIAIPVFAHSSNDTTQFENNSHHCSHSFAFEFDDTTMTLDGAYTINTIEWLMEDVDYFGDKAVVYENGTILTEGLLKEGMSIEIYHDDQLYGTYTIEKLREPHPEIPPQQNNTNKENPDTAPQTGHSTAPLLLVMIAAAICAFLFVPNIRKSA